ncbi:MAG: MBL fold metallo-hydrolase [Verrucomicrobia bacterium]|nr:MBL fold metallo-hydrolase [Verrucomicrobiota bacterium]
METAQSRVLIDAGFTGKKIHAMLEQRGMSISDIDAVFLTHEHTDHAQGVRGLSKASHLRYFATMATARAIQRGLSRTVNWQLFESGQTFVFEDVTVQSIAIPHDAYDPVAYVFRWGGEDLFNPHRSVAWLTDLGYVPGGCAQLVKDVDDLVIEANHDSDMLQNDVKRPYSLKQRISGRHGHLSNADCLTFLESIVDPRWKAVHLAHLSRDCNDVDIVRKLFCSCSPFLRCENYRSSQSLIPAVL